MRIFKNILISAYFDCNYVKKAVSVLWKEDCTQKTRIKRKISPIE